MKLISEINGSGLYAQSALSASTASYDSLGNEITATYATKSEIPSLDGLMETDKLEFDSNNKITAYNGSAFAGQSSTSDLVYFDYEDGTPELTWSEIQAYMDAGKQLIIYDRNAVSDGKTKFGYVSNYNKADKFIQFNNVGNTTSGTTPITGINWAYLGNSLGWQRTGAQGGGGIAEVVTSEPITGNGTTESPIGAETIEIESINLEAGEGIDITDGVISVTGGQGGSTYTTDDTEYLNIDNTDSKINFTDKTKQAIDNVPTGTNYDLVGGENIKFTVDDTEHQIVIDVEAPLSTYQIFDYGTASAQQTIDCWKEGKIPVLRIPGYSALLWPCRLPTVDPTTLTTAQYQYFGCNYNASSFTAYLYSTSSRASGLFTACNQSTYTSYTANANKWLSAVSAQSANWNTVSSLSANKEDKITFGYNDGKIVSMNGSALSAGSNYEGISPIVVDNEAKTIGANTRSVGMQTFSHDDSLVHIESNEEYALGVNTRMFPCDETVLWEGNEVWPQTLTLKEPVTNFEKIEIINGHYQHGILHGNQINGNNNSTVYYHYMNISGSNFGIYACNYSANGTTLKSNWNRMANLTTSGATYTDNHIDYSTRILKVIGIGRKEGV